MVQKCLNGTFGFGRYNSDGTVQLSSYFSIVSYGTIGPNEIILFVRYNSVLTGQYCTYDTIMSVWYNTVSMVKFFPNGIIMSIRKNILHMVLKCLNGTIGFGRYNSDRTV